MLGKVEEILLWLAPLKAFNSIIAPLGYQTPPTAYQNSPFGRRIRRASNRKETRVKHPKRRASITPGDARQMALETGDFGRRDRGLWA